MVLSTLRQLVGDEGVPRREVESDMASETGYVYIYEKRCAKTRAVASSVVCVRLPDMYVLSLPPSPPPPPIMKISGAGRGIKVQFPRVPEIMQVSSRKSGNEARVLSIVLSLFRALSSETISRFSRGNYTSLLVFCKKTRYESKLVL